MRRNARILGKMDTVPTLDLKLDRPLAVFDIESTGTNPRTDRMVELAIIKIMPDGQRLERIDRINPQMPIPPGAIAVHGITDEDVAECLPFDDIAADVEEFLTDCDLGGYNLIRYDIPMLEEEFIRARLRFRTDGRRIIDAQRIFHKNEPRDLTAALAFYCDREHDGAHGALADADATLRVLQGQLKHYPELPHDMEELDLYCNPRDSDWVDRMGRLKWINGDIAINFGRKKGMALKKMIEQDPNFIKWMLRSDFPRDTLDIIRRAGEGEYPDPPAP